jgi:hypothetical protein
MNKKVDIIEIDANLVEAHNVRMPQLLEHLDLAVNLCQVVGVQSPLVHDFDGNLNANIQIHMRFLIQIGIKSLF